MGACSVSQSSPTLCDLKDCSPPYSSIHGIFLAKILEWAASSYSRVSSQGSNLHLLYWRADSLPLNTWEDHTPNKQQLLLSSYCLVAIIGTSLVAQWLRIHLGEGNGNPLQYSCLEKSMDRGAWQTFSQTLRFSCTCYTRGDAISKPSTRPLGRNTLRLRAAHSPWQGGGGPKSFLSQG